MVRGDTQMATNHYVVAKRYSKALWDSLDSPTNAKATSEELRGLQETFQQPEFWQFLTQPTFDVAQKLSVATQVLEKAGASKIVARFMEQLIKAGRIEALPEVVHSFEMLFRASEGVVEANVETALPLNEKQKSDIAAGLSRVLGKKVFLTVVDKPELIAGVRVLVEGRLMDGSLTSNVNNLEKSLLSERAVGA
jgi:F-type H+-transporting ATPase subunit delta